MTTRLSTSTVRSASRPLSGRHARLVVSLALIVAATLGLAACYFPMQFRADVVVSRSGYYDIAFSGQVAWLPLLRSLRDGELDAAEEQDKARLIERDLARDPATKEVRYLGRGVFHLQWRRSGDLLSSGMVSFIRRGERLVTLKYLRHKGLIVLNGRRLTDDTARRLGPAADAVDGIIELYTDAPVLEHNATEAYDIDGGERLYRWRLETATDPAPRMVMAVR